MDPNATFELFLTALADDRIADAADHATDLRQWIEKGGFEPSHPEYSFAWIAEF